MQNSSGNRFYVPTHTIMLCASTNVISLAPGSRLLLQLIPKATISIYLCFCYYVLSFFFIASYVWGEDIVKLLAFFFGGVGGRG